MEWTALSSFCLECWSWSFSLVLNIWYSDFVKEWSAQSSSFLECSSWTFSQVSIFCDGMDCFIILMFRMPILVFFSILFFYSLVYSLILWRTGPLNHRPFCNANLDLFLHSQYFIVWFCAGMVCSIILLFGMLILVFLSILIFNWKMTKGEYRKIRYMSLLHNLIIYGNSWNYVQALKDHLSHCKICDLKQTKFHIRWTQKPGKLFGFFSATSRLLSFFLWYVFSLVSDIICNLKQR